MSGRDNSATRILVVDDVEEIRDSIEKLLQFDGYRVEPTRSEERAIESAQRIPPHLILMNLDGPAEEIIAAARRIRHAARVDPRVPVVLLSAQAVAEGAEVDVGDNVYLTRPDNFDQVRAFMSRLLHRTVQPEGP